MKCGYAMWNGGVVHVEYGGVLMQNEVVVLSDVIRFDTLLDMAVRCGMIVEMQCAMCAVG